LTGLIDRRKIEQEEWRMEVDAHDESTIGFERAASGKWLADP
jgi:hypothetical protein